MQDNYKTIATKLGNNQPFNGNSLRAYISDGTLWVISYNTLIATRSLLTSAAWVAPKKYSVTTSRQQNLIRRAWGIK